MRVQPFSLIVLSFASVIVSGLPASTVYSFTPDISKQCSMHFINAPSCSASIDVGVPPPKYTVSSFKPSLFVISAVCLISRHILSMYSGISFLPLSSVCEINEQYEHLVGQNGIETYKLNDFLSSDLQHHHTVQSKVHYH